MQKGLIKRMIWGIFFVFLCVVALLWGQQRRLMYHPRTYTDEQYARLAAVNGVALQFETSQGAQEAYYIPPRQGDASALPARLWIFFNGNGSCSLDWLGFISRTRDLRAGYLLIEYPGYGRSEGKPTAKNIDVSARQAVEELARHLQVEFDVLAVNANILGYSMGTATGLAATRWLTPGRIILVAPFTTMVEIARRTVGWPLCLLAVDRYDSRHRLQVFSEQETRPKVTIFHGTADRVVPVEMGRELAHAHEGWIRYVEVPYVGHELVSVCEPLVMAALEAGVPETDLAPLPEGQSPLPNRPTLD